MLRGCRLGLGRMRMSARAEVEEVMVALVAGEDAGEEVGVVGSEAAAAPEAGDVCGSISDLRQRLLSPVAESTLVGTWHDDVKGTQ